MKRVILIIIGLVLIGFGLFSLFNETDEETINDENVTIGYIFAIEDNRILVAEGLSEGIEKYSGDIDELKGSAVWFTITEETEILDSEGDIADQDVFELKKEVEVYSKDPLLMSYPAQGGADKVVLTGEVYNFEEIDFDKVGNLILNNPGFEEGFWYLSFDEPGQHLAIKLLFDTNSICIYEEEKVCDQEIFTPGDRVWVIGKESGDDVLVKKLIKQ